MKALNLTFQYISDAAQFRLQLQPWLIDRDFVDNRGTIYYAVDTDVVKLYSAPQNMQKYAHVFSKDTSKTTAVIAWALGQYIFSSLIGKEPLLIIPPHHLELERVINGIAHDAAKEQEAAFESLPQIEKAILDYKKTKNPDGLIKLFRKKPLSLINYAYGLHDGYNAELDRITTLITDTRILYIDRYVDRRKGEPTTLPILQDDVKAEDYEILNELSQSWQKRLKQTKSKSRSKLRISDDAEVLARLEWINNEMQDEQKRLLLISGDPSLQRAANRYLLESGKSFADLYVRNPLVFLAAPDFLPFNAEPESKDRVRRESRIIRLGLIKSFDVFLAQYEPGRTGYTKRLQDITAIKNEEKQQEIAKAFIADEEGQKSLQRLIADWQQFVQLTGFVHGFTSEESPNIIEKIGSENFSELRQKILKKANDVWENFLKSATELGFWSTNAFETKIEKDSDHRLLPLRGIPAPRFTLEPACTYIKKLCLTLQYGPITRQEISFNDLIKKDKSGYSAFFLFSLAFGAEGRWGVSRILAKHALDIAEYLGPDQQLPRDLEPITGNEAAYLLAWAIRHSVKNVEMLEKAIYYLKEAVKRKIEAVGGDGTDIRYSSEYIAIYMTCHFFRIFKKQTFMGEVPSLEECHNRIIQLLNQLNQDRDEEEHIRKTVQKQLFVYLFCSYLLRRFKEKSHVLPEQEREVLNLLPNFQRLLESQEPPTKTCFTQPVYWAACSTLSEDTEKKKECQRETERIFQKEEIYLRRCSVMPYDEELYGFLYNLVCNPCL